MLWGIQGSFSVSLPLQILAVLFTTFSHVSFFSFFCVGIGVHGARFAQRLISLAWVGSSCLDTLQCFAFFIIISEGFTTVYYIGRLSNLHWVDMIFIYLFLIWELLYVGAWDIHVWFHLPFSCFYDKSCLPMRNLHVPWEDGFLISILVYRVVCLFWFCFSGIIFFGFICLSSLVSCISELASQPASQPSVLLLLLYLLPLLCHVFCHVWIFFFFFRCAVVVSMVVVI